MRLSCNGAGAKVKLTPTISQIHTYRVHKWLYELKLEKNTIG